MLNQKFVKIPFNFSNVMQGLGVYKTPFSN